MSARNPDRPSRDPVVLIRPTPQAYVDPEVSRRIRERLKRAPTPRPGTSRGAP